MGHRTILLDKIRESVSSVTPILLVVFLLSLTFVPFSTDLMLGFLLGAFMLIVGMGFFTLGAELAMSPIGRMIGGRMTKTRKLWLILIISFALGVAITVSEPDLQVLAKNVPHINATVLILTVAIGVGAYLMVAMLRTIFAIQLRWILLGSYILVFALAALLDQNFLSIAFDSGGVTTGPMTVPFIMAMGVGVARMRSDKNAEADSFGLVALSSIGPILAVMALSFAYPGTQSASQPPEIPSFGTTTSLAGVYLHELPLYLFEIALALAPIAIFFLIFQVLAFRLERHAFMRIIIGLVYTYIGLVLFLTGVNVGFSPLGTQLGLWLGTGSTLWALLPVGALMGWFTISAEPAVHVLNKQVEEVSSGSISARAMGTSLALAVCLAVALAMVRVIVGLPILYFLIPGYALALILTFFVPPIFTAIAFDSGGVASGPMTATFLLPFAVGASHAAGTNPLSDAFGLVALVAMMPLITIQIMGVIYVVKTRRAEAISSRDDTEIIELWG